ncbi:MAG: adenine/guanine/hypoxanthine permease [Verrucomicrobiota bacterium]|nr:adenine/guanine/hypoxanthine permease [Verrucomicrobiota bacterium]
MRWFSRGDGEGFVVAFVNNRVQLLILSPLCPGGVGFSAGQVCHRAPG